MRARAIMTGALALALIVVRFVAGAAIARPLTAERRLDADQRHETVRTLRTAGPHDARPRLATDPAALPPAAPPVAAPHRAAWLVRAAAPGPHAITADRTARARAPPRAG